MSKLLPLNIGQNGQYQIDGTAVHTGSFAMIEIMTNAVFTTLKENGASVLVRDNLTGKTVIAGVKLYSKKGVSFDEIKLASGTVMCYRDVE